VLPSSKPWLPDDHHVPGLRLRCRLCQLAEGLVCEEAGLVLPAREPGLPLDFDLAAVRLRRRLRQLGQGLVAGQEELVLQPCAPRVPGATGGDVNVAALRLRLRGALYVARRQGKVVLQPQAHRVPDDNHVPPV